MCALKLLLIQARPAGDPMLSHERACIGQRLGARRVELRAHNAVQRPLAESELDSLDAVVIGGSGAYSVHHPLSRPWVEPLRRSLDAILQRQLPGFGICFGHQLLGMHLGADVLTDPQGEEVGTVSVKLTAHGRRDPLFATLGSETRVQTGHSDSVTSVPPGVRLLATSESLDTQAFKVEGAPFYSTQFHPDLTAAEARQRYLSGSTTDDEHVRERERRAAAFVEDSPVVTELIGRFVDMLCAQRDADAQLDDTGDA